MTTKRLPSVEGIVGVSCLVLTKTAKEEYGASVVPSSMVQFKCEFCRAPILGKPLIEYIDSGKFYFSGEECANAYNQRRALSQKPSASPEVIRQEV